MSALLFHFTLFDVAFFKTTFYNATFFNATIRYNYLWHNGETLNTYDLSL